MAYIVFGLQPKLLLIRRCEHSEATPFKIEHFSAVFEITHLPCD